MSKGLPVELAVRVMHFMNYKAKRRLTIPNDPFHPGNKEELVKYLKYCWKLLVCCEVMAKALGMHINWREEVSQSLVELWTSESCGPWHWPNVLASTSLVSAEKLCQLESNLRKTHC